MVNYLFYFLWNVTRSKRSVVRFLSFIPLKMVKFVVNIVTYICYFWEALLHPIENLTGSVPVLWHFGTDPDPWIRILLFVSDLEDTSKTKFLAYFFFFESTFISFFQDKKSYRPQNSTKKFFFFCLLMKGSGSESVPLTNGSGSGEARKNLRILRTRNTASWYRTLRLISYSVERPGSGSGSDPEWRRK